MDQESDLFVGRVACRYVRALVIRLTFMVHALLTLWRVYLLRGDDMYWSFTALLLLLPLETVITLKIKKGGEWAWFCPSFFFFLLSVLPSIWLLELDRLYRHRALLIPTNITDTITTQSTLEVFVNNISSITLKNDTIFNNSGYDIITEKHNQSTIELYNKNNSSEITGSFTSTTEGFDGPKTSVVDQSSETKIFTSGSTTETSNLKTLDMLLDALDPDNWVLALEQSMLYLLILGRWFLPRGKMTHDQLSQLLFVYIGMSSDIMELFYLFDEKAVVRDGVVGYIILTAWSVSLLQFTLILTAVSAKKRRVTHSIENVFDKVGNGCMCLHNEIWAILVTVFLQDAPFLSIRLYVAIGLKVVNYSLIFFTVKNVVVILLQMYRLVVVGCYHDNTQPTELDAVEIPLANGRKKHKITDEESEMYGTFYNDVAVAATQKLRTGVAPLASTEKLVS